MQNVTLLSLVFSDRGSVFTLLAKRILVKVTCSEAMEVNVVPTITHLIHSS